jgi:hypothetical protein
VKYVELTGRARAPTPAAVPTGPAHDLPTDDHRHGAAARTGPPGPASVRPGRRDVTACEVRAADLGFAW